MITQQLASQVIIDILNQEMGMPANAVWLRDQNRTIPNDNNLYIAVGMVGSPQIIANITEVYTQVVNNLPVQYESNFVQQQEVIQIDVLSSVACNLALFRNWEVVAALNSIYSQQQQELNNFKIFRIPRNLIDTSSAEGGSVIQRYSITIICFTWYRKIKALGDYYDDFTVRVDDEKTIGTPTPEIAFEITPETPPPFGE